MVDGLRPCIPGGTGSTCRSCPRREMYPCGTCYPCPGGEDHLKRRSSSPPVPPLLGCRHCPEKGGSVCFAPKHKLPSALGTCLVGTISAAGGSAQGCRGRSPRRNKLLGSPFPAGRGEGGMGEKSKLKAGRASAAGGWGQQSKLKAGQGGNSNRQAPLQVPQRQGYPAPQGQALLPPAPPPGTGLAASARNRKENTPAGNNRRGCS